MRPRPTFLEPHVRVFVCRYNWLQPGVRSSRFPFWRIYHNDREGVYHTVDGKEYPTLPGEITAVPPLTRIGRRTEHPVQHFFIHAYTAPAYQQVKPHIVQFKAPAGLMQYIEELKPEVEVSLANTRFDAVVTMKMLAIAHYTLAQVRPEMLDLAEIDERIERAIHLIEDEFPRTVKNDQLAAVACMSTSAFIRTFSKQVGVSPQRYVFDKRLDKAESLLQYSDMPVADIAEDCGFGDRNYFSRAFRQSRGKAPAQFRRDAVD